MEEKNDNDRSVQDEAKQDLQASILFENKNNVWINDKMVSNCHLCQKKIGRTLFKPLNGKHHCRNCGNIFCESCSSKYIIIPSFVTDKPKAEDFWNPSFYIHSLRGERERVCNKCFDLVTEKIKAREKIISILKNPKSIDEINALDESDIEVKKHYRDQLRNIQYYLPNHNYSDTDKKLLAINCHFFAKHSKYLIHYIKSIYSIKQSNKEYLETIFSIINSQTKNKTCRELRCTRICQETLSCDDCINILYSCVKYLPDELVEYLFKIIDKTPECVILCHLSFFVNQIKHNKNNKLLTNLIFGLLSGTITIKYQTYWFLNNAKDTASTEEVRNIENFIKLFDPGLVSIMQKEYKFYAGLINNLDNPKRYLIDAFDENNEISLPYDPTTKLTAVDVDNIKICDSYTKPALIPFETTTIDPITGKKEIDTITILFKKESIMNDVVVLNLMTLCDIILKDHLNDNFNVVVYPVMPLTNNSGMIEIVEDAETVYEITKRRKKTILQYIMEKNDNGESVVSDVLDRYMYSLVSYTLHNYFLGLGDRHLQNIMITDDGAIFHIDFGFILGKDVCPFTVGDIKLNSDMLQVIGGMGGTRCKIYFDLCADGLKLLRKHFNMFFILLTQDIKFNKEDIEKFIMARFQPRKSDKHIVSELHSVIKKSTDTLGDAFRDLWHFHTQERTIQNGATKLFNAAYSIVKKLTTGNK